MGPKPHFRLKSLDGAQLASSPGLPFPQHRCGTAWRSQQGRSIRICGRGFSNRLFSQQRLISQVCKGRIALNCSLGRTKEGNTSKISFFIISSISQSCYPADVESFVFLSGVGSERANSQGDKTNPWFSPCLVRCLCPIQKALIWLWSSIHSQLQLWGYCSFCGPFLIYFFGTQLYTLLEKLQSSCWMIEFKICLDFALLTHKGAWGSLPGAE